MQFACVHVAAALTQDEQHGLLLSGRNFVATSVVGVQAEQSQSVSQDAVVTAAKEVKEMDPDYMPPSDIATALR